MKPTRLFFPAALALVAFALWTAAVCTVDVQPIGPGGSTVGLATLNRSFHTFTGVHLWLYVATDWLSLLPVGMALAFALLGLAQWIRRRSLARVDRSLLVLGGFYLAVMAAYALFEMLVINRRPVLLDGVLEASYPSSTTLLVLCVSATAILQLRGRIRRPGLRRCLCGLLAGYAALMVLARLLCGVHWLSDVVGGVLLSAALILTYRACIRLTTP